MRTQILETNLNEVVCLAQKCRSYQDFCKRFWKHYAWLRSNRLTNELKKILPPRQPGQKKRYGPERRRLMLRRWKSQPHNRLAQNTRTRVSGLLRGHVKSAPTLVLLGCSLEQLKAHLEAQFKPGMSWDNYGQWHVDHKRPCASFDLSKPEDQRACFHYTNLQPLWAKENRVKNSRYTLPA